MNETRQLLQSGHGSDAGRAKRKQQRRAASFRYDPRMERVAELREKEPAEYSKLPPDTKTSLGYYLNTKAAAEAEGLDVSAPGERGG